MCVKTPRDSCCAHVSATGYLTPKVPSMTIKYCSDTLSCHCLSLSLSLASSFLFPFPLLQSPYNPSCKSASELWLPGLKIPAPWQCSVTRLSASYLIHLSLLFWLIFASPISFSLSYVILIWLCQNLIWPMLPFSKSPHQSHSQYGFNLLALLKCIKLICLHFSVLMCTKVVLISFFKSVVRISLGSYTIES